ncbi:MAG: hypothetical protein AAB578_02465 [Elusimicrobiota bacterium]
MVETGDGREGAPAAEAAVTAKALATAESVKLAGLATTAACARPVGRTWERAGCA